MAAFLFLVAGDTLGWFSGHQQDFYFPSGQQVEIAVRLEPVCPGFVDSGLVWHPGSGTDSLVIRLFEAGTETRPGPVLATDTVELSGQGWRGFELPVQLSLAGGQDLWLSARYLDPAATQVFGADTGPGIRQGGCFITRNNGTSWDEMWRYGIDTDFNWCLAAIIHPEAEPRDVAAESVILDPVYVYKGFPVIPKIYYQNYSDTIVETPIRARVFDSNWTQVYSNDTVVRLYPYGYYGDGDTISFAATNLPEGLYHITGTVMYPGDTFAQNDTARAITAVVSHKQEFESDIEDQGWWVVGQGWKAYSGYQSWAHWQGLPFGSQCYMNDNGGFHQGEIASRPLVLSPGAELFFYSATDFAPESTGNHLVIFMIGSQRDTVDLSDFTEKQWTLLHYPVPITTVETVRVAFCYSSSDEWYIDEMALTLVDTILSAKDGGGSGDQARSFKCATVAKGSLPVEVFGPCQLQLFDVSGRMVRSWQLAGPGNFKLNTGDLRAGVFFIREPKTGLVKRVELLP